MYDLYEITLGFLQIITYVCCIPIYVIILSIELFSHLFCCRKRFQNPESVLITGGASGIGRALALEYTRRGTKYVALADLNGKMLEEAKIEVEALGAKVSIATLDVCNKEAVKAWVLATDAAHPLDVVHANAGYAESSAGLDAFVDLEKASYRLTDVNVMGVVNTVLPALAAMRERRHGQIVVTASLAGFTQSLNSIPGYAASKNWARAWALGLRGHFWTTGVRVSALCPGFITTPMTQQVPRVVNGVRLMSNRGFPGEVGVAWAARQFVDGVALDKAVITFPYLVLLAAQAFHGAPLVVADFALRSTSPESALAHAWGPSAPALVSPTPARTADPAPPATADLGAESSLTSPGRAGGRRRRGSVAH